MVTEKKTNSKGFFSKIFKKEGKTKPVQPPGQKKFSNFFEEKKGIVTEIIVHSPLEKKLLEPRPEKPKEEAPKTFNFDKMQKPEQEVKKESKIMLLTIHGEDYTKNIHYLAEYMGGKYPRVLYVSLNELYSNLFVSLREAKVDVKKFYFIDAITSTAETNVQKKDNCVFVVSPNALVELSLAISSAIEEQKPRAVLFDSISTLLIYENPKTVVKFVHSLIGKIRAASIDAFFTALEGDAKTPAIEDLGMFVDEFMSMDKFRMYKIELGFEQTEKKEPAKKK
ncbi:MAG: ATPase domain-containing protein [archaeon]|nr:ATPase domain-containing protein [archaeon]